jgi:hypothetical protein
MATAKYTKNHIENPWIETIYIMNNIRGIKIEPITSPRKGTVLCGITPMHQDINRVSLGKNNPNSKNQNPISCSIIFYC